MSAPLIGSLVTVLFVINGVVQMCCYVTFVVLCCSGADVTGESVDSVSDVGVGRVDVDVTS